MNAVTNVDGEVNNDFAEYRNAEHIGPLKEFETINDGVTN